MSVVPVRDAADRVTEDFDERLRHVFVIVSRAGLAEVLQQPVFVRSRFSPPCSTASSQTQSKKSRMLDRDSCFRGVSCPQLFLTVALYSSLVPFERFLR